MSKVISLDENRPHVVIHGEKAGHVFPLAMFQNVVEGKLLITKVDDIDDFIPQIIKEWLERFEV